MLTRDELFALAALPIGDREEQDKSNPGHRIATPTAIAAAKRAQKIWLPDGKTSALSRESRQAERDAKARNFDIEDAIENAGGKRGSGSQT